MNQPEVDGQLDLIDEARLAASLGQTQADDDAPPEQGEGGVVDDHPSLETARQNYRPRGYDTTRSSGQQQSWLFENPETARSVSAVEFKKKSKSAVGEARQTLEAKVAAAEARVKSGLDYRPDEAAAVTRITNDDAATVNPFPTNTEDDNYIDQQFFAVLDRDGITDSDDIVLPRGTTAADIPQEGQKIHNKVDPTDEEGLTMADVPDNPIRTPFPVRAKADNSDNDTFAHDPAALELSR